MLAFYGQVLGCSVKRRLDALGLVQLRAGRSLIDLVPVDSKIGHAGGAAPGRGRLAAHGMSGFVRALAFYPLLFYPALLDATLWVPIAAIWAASLRRLDRKEIA